MQMKALVLWVLTCTLQANQAEATFLQVTQIWYATITIHYTFSGSIRTYLSLNNATHVHSVLLGFTVALWNKCCDAEPFSTWDLGPSQRSLLTPDCTDGWWHYDPSYRSYLHRTGRWRRIATELHMDGGQVKTQGRVRCALQATHLLAKWRWRNLELERMNGACV